MVSGVETGWLKPMLSRLVLILLGIGAALLILEGALQITAVFMGTTTRDPAPWIQDKWRMLAVGDSNTYGLYLDKSQAYPMVFEALWNARPGNRPIQGQNLAFPGTNSSKLVKDCRRMRWAFRPDMVSVMVGRNDFWTLPETAGDSPHALDRLAAALWKVSRVYRLLYMVRRAILNPRLEVTSEPSGEGLERGHGTARYGSDEFELGWVHRPDSGVPNWQPDKDLEKNLITLANEIREFGAGIIFLTYPAETGMYGVANEIIRHAAKSARVPMIDLGTAFRPLCPAGRCAELFGDQHPSAVGHERAAHILQEQLLPPS